MTLMASGPTSWPWVPDAESGGAPAHTDRSSAPRDSSSMSALSVMSSLPTVSPISYLCTHGVLAAPAATRPGVFG